jgi:hypothetical protein
MTVISGTDKKAIKSFVQGVLGCTCPNEVFLNIKLEKNPSNFADLSRGDLISIGGTLLVYLIKPNDGEELVGKLELLFNRGQETRDKGGFNRFRLVVSTSRIQPTQEILARQFETLEDLDGRLHLHVIGIEQLPDLIAQ